MRPITDQKPKRKKKHYYGLLDGEYIGQTWAVSEKKARANLWWIFVKGQDEASPREYDPDDIDLCCQD